MSVLKSQTVDKLTVKVYSTRDEMGRAAAAEAAAAIKAAIAEKGEINMIFAAAPSQNEFLSYLIADKGIDFSKINAFHMDEYIGLASDAPQGFANFLRERLFDRVPFASVNTIDSSADPQAEYGYEAIFAGTEKLPVTEHINSPLHIAVSRSHSNDETAQLIARVTEDYPDATIMEQGSSYKLCLIAEGSIDYYPRTSDTYEWDTAAGEAIITAAGGRIYSLDDASVLQYNKASLLNPYFACRSKWFPK